MSLARVKTVSEKHWEESSQNFHPEVQSLVDRIRHLKPEDMAQALYEVESQKAFASLFGKQPELQKPPAQLIFARGLLFEIENIYLELARHLQAGSTGSNELMTAVFEFLGKSLRALGRVPQLYSLN